MKKLITLTILVSALFAVSNIVQAQGLVQNGSFEQFYVYGSQARITVGSTSITGWTVGGAGDVYVMNGPGNGGVFNPAQDGSYYVDLSGDGTPHATLYQDIATSIGGQYSLSFYIGSASDQPSSTINVGLLGTGTLLDTTLTPLAPNAGSLNWLQETFSFTADSTTTRLSFVDMSAIDDNASFIDNVSVTATPEPTTMALVGVGLASLFVFRKLAIKKI